MSAREEEMMRDKNISISSVKPSVSLEDRICDTCIKEDVCMLSRYLHKAVDDIKEISERTEVFIDTNVRCKKWSSKNTNFTQYPLCKIVKMGVNPRCGHLIYDKYCNDKNILCTYQET